MQRTLFRQANITTKNKLLRFVPTNSVLWDKSITLQVIYPYTAFIQLNKKPQDGANGTNWCTSLCRLLTQQATELQGDVAFAELVDLLGLRGDLLAV